jgi:hypothetical protein
LDRDGVLYRRVKRIHPKLVVPQYLIQDVIARNHHPIFVVHPGSKRTFEVISLKYWWSKMRQSIDEYVRRCDKCQRRKGKQELRAPLGEVGDPSEHFQVTAIDITGPYSTTPRKKIFPDFYPPSHKLCRSVPYPGRFGRDMCESLCYQDFK